jgi:hypothetical protein
MSVEIGPGSVVECVDASGTLGLQMGSIYRVARIEPTVFPGANHPVVIPFGFPPQGTMMSEGKLFAGYRLDRFKPIGGSATSIQDVLSLSSKPKVRV